MAASKEPYRDYRLFDFAIDKQWARTYNEHLKEIRRLQISAAILAAVVIAGAVAAVLFIPDRIAGYMVAFVLGVFALGMLAMIVVIPQKMGAIERTYAISELVPALIADVRPHVLVLVALVDLAVDRKVGSVPALATLSCEKLPNTQHTVGQRVPCVAVAANRSARGKDNRYQFMSPMPIAWATPDKDVLRQAIAQIPNAEWETVRRHLGRVEEIQKAPTRALPLSDVSNR